MDIRAVLASLVEGQELSDASARWLFTQILAEQLDPMQIAAALALMQQRGVRVHELVAAARVMRSHVTPVPVEPHLREHVIDTCGTGGAIKTFNVSTLAAIVAASVQAPDAPVVRVAKHGNRSRTGRGSAEILEALGVNVHASPDAQAACLREAGVCFSFAVHHHPAARHAAPARMALGFPTIFNLLGPLCNPAGAERQLLGVYNARGAETMAHALAALGCRHAWVLHSEDGLDELSVCAPTHIWEVRGQGAHSVHAWKLSLEEVRALGLGMGMGIGHQAPTLQALRVSDLGQALMLAQRVLQGEPGLATDMVVLNAAAALVVGGGVRTLTEGVEAAQASLRAGAAWATLAKLRAASTL
jgi:anthranilate phosphoribosyltransferase